LNTLPAIEGTNNSQVFSLSVDLIIFPEVVFSSTPSVDRNIDLAAAALLDLASGEQENP
jgi:hypothetical protein